MVPPMVKIRAWLKVKTVQRTERVQKKV